MKKLLIALLIAIGVFFLVYFFFGKFSRTYFGVSYQSSRQEDEFRKSLRETGAYTEEQIDELIAKSRKAWRIGTDKIKVSVSNTMNNVEDASVDLSQLTKEQMERLTKMVEK